MGNRTPEEEQQKLSKTKSNKGEIREAGEGSNESGEQEKRKNKM